MKILNKFKFFLLLLISISLFSFVLADTECSNRDCSIGVSINVAGVPKGAFTGSVLDLTGTLVSNVNITVLQTNYSTITTTGIYSISGVDVGVYSLTASADGHLSQARTNQPIMSGTTTTVDFTLAPTGGIRGNVVDFFTGSGINGVEVTLTLYGEEVSSTLTNAAGYYEFTGLIPGYYDLSVSAAGYTDNSKPDNQVLSGLDTIINFWLW